MTRLRLGEEIRENNMYFVELYHMNKGESLVLRDCDYECRNFT